MKDLKDYIFETSKEKAESALAAAVKDIKELTDQFAQSKFKDENILAKLQKRARQVDVFKDYIEDLNNSTVELFSSSVKKILDKYKDGIELSNGSIFKPLFVLTSGEHTQWGKKYDFGPEKWDNARELTFEYLTVIGLNSDYSKEKKTLSKVGADTSSIEAIEQEYEKINQELKDDLSKVLGLKYSSISTNRKNYNNPYNTIVMFFKIEDNIDVEKISKLLPGYQNIKRGPVKYDRGRGSDSYGRFVDIYKTKELEQNLN